MLPKYCIECINRKKSFMDNNYNNAITNPTPHYSPQQNPNPTTNINTTAVMPMQTNQQNTNVDQNQQFVTAPGSPTLLGIEYTQGYLRTLIGKKVLVEFLIGTDSITDRSGILTEVGISYIIIRETETNDLLLCDIYSIKFVTIYS